MNIIIIVIGIFAAGSAMYNAHLNDKLRWRVEELEKRNSKIVITNKQQQTFQKVCEIYNIDPETYTYYQFVCDAFLKINEIEKQLKKY
jgi:hypothetical protein